MPELYSFSKANRFFSKPLYKPSFNDVSVIPSENGKSKKHNVLKPNDIPGPGQYRILFHFFLDP
jgi:hypothetical protein